MADEVTEQKHTISLKDLTKTNKKQNNLITMDELKSIHHFQKYSEQSPQD